MSLRTLPLAGGDQAAAAHDRRRGFVVAAAFVGSGILTFLIGAVLLIAWGADVAAPGGWAGPHALALVHVLAIGFISALAIGVLYHLSPLAFGRPLPVAWFGLVAWAAYETGAGLMIGGLATGHPALLAAGGSTLGCSILAVTVHLGAVAAGARRRHPPTLFQVAAGAALCCVAVLGAVLALLIGLHTGADVLTILATKIVLAIGGWLGILVVGVSYQLIPMFTITPARERFLRRVLVLMSLGVVLTAVAVGARLPWPVRLAPALVYAAGIGLHAVDVIRFVAPRRDRRITPVMAGQVAGATLLVAGTVEGLLAVAGLGQPWPQLAVAIALVGWAPTLIAANAIRIVPFIIWQGRPPGRRPRTYGSAPAGPGWSGVAAAVTAGVVMSAALAAGSGVAGRLAGCALLASALSVATGAAGGLRRLRRDPPGPPQR